MKALRILNVLALLVMLATNALASATELIGGQQTAVVSDSNPTLFTPAGYVFSIWGVIYLGLVALVIYQALGTPEAEAVRARIGPWFIVNALLNAGWLFLWGAELLWASVVVMLGILATLIVLYKRLGIGRAVATPGQRWAVRLPVSIYTGWISVATIANIATALVNAGWQGGALGPRPWTAVVLVVGAGLGLLAGILRRDAAYALVVVWAFVGIIMARPDETLIAIVAGVGALAVLLGIPFGYLRRRYRPA